MRRSLLVAGAVVLAASCAPSHAPLRASGTPTRLVSDHLIPTASGQFYCKVTDTTFDAAELEAHLGHWMPKLRSSHAGIAHAIATTREEAAVRKIAASDAGVAPPDVIGVAEPTPAAGCRPTAQQRAAADALVADTTAAIATYANVSNALLAGYRVAGAPDEHRAQYYVNDEFSRDSDVLDPANVESLVYGWTDRHGLVLIGAMYSMPQAGMHGPAVGGCLTPWRVHRTQDGLGPRELPEMLHVWTVDMPGGRFAAHADADVVRTL